MKMNENLCDKVITALRYGITINEDMKQGFYDFARTINAINALDSKGYSALMITANDYRSYSLEQYEIAEPFQTIILPGKVSVLNDYLATETRDVPYYKDDVLEKGSILTPQSFKAFQAGLFMRARRSAINYVPVANIKRTEVRVEEVSHRLAVHEGFFTIIGKVAGALLGMESSIAMEVPSAPVFPIVVNVFYKDKNVYTYSADDMVVAFFAEVILRDLAN